MPVSLFRENRSFYSKGLAVLTLTLALFASVGVGKAAEVAHVQSVASAREGATLTMSRYTVPADGLLVVRIGAKGPTSRSVTFDGRDMIRISSVEVSYSTAISAEMYSLPVSAGESGAIEVDYGFGGTDGKAIIAATLLGVDSLKHVQTFNDGETFSEGRTGPNTAASSISTPKGSVILSVLTDHGRGIPEEAGVGHRLDAHPTVPEAAFHETKVMAGHVMAPMPGTYSLGYQNTDQLGYMDYAMIVATFSSSAPVAAVPFGSPASRVLLSLGLLLVPAFGRKGRLGACDRPREFIADRLPRSTPVRRLAMRSDGVRQRDVSPRTRKKST